MDFASASLPFAPGGEAAQRPNPLANGPPEAQAPTARDGGLPNLAMHTQNAVFPQSLFPPHPQVHSALFKGQQGSVLAQPAPSQGSMPHQQHPTHAQQPLLLSIPSHPPQSSHPVHQGSQLQHQPVDPGPQPSQQPAAASAVQASAQQPLQLEQPVVISSSSQRERDNYGLVLPLSRIKKLIKQEGSVKAISAEASFAVAKATELLVESLAVRAAAHMREGSRSIIIYKDVASSVKEWPAADFLADIVPETITVAELRELLAKQQEEQKAAAAANGDGDDDEDL